MRVMFHIKPDELAEAIAEDNEWNHDEIESLIRSLDANMRDYDFTLSLAKHFVSELISECEASGEIFDVNTLLSK